LQIKVYGYKGCSTCRKATRFLDERAVSYESVDITTTPPTPAELASMLTVYGGKVKKLLNTSGQAYRELGLGERLKTLSEADALALLAGNGRLVKRPFLLVDGQAKAVGFDEATWGKVL
jgi:arsenate reductase